MLVSGVLLLLVLCACVLLTNHLVPEYGLLVRPADSHFTMGMYDRSQSHLVTVLPGDEPRLYIDSAPVEGGMSAFPALLDSWANATPSQVMVIFVVDEAVTAGVVQRLTDMVLQHGYSCSMAGTPAA